MKIVRNAQHRITDVKSVRAACKLLGKLNLSCVMNRYELPSFTGKKEYRVTYGVGLREAVDYTDRQFRYLPSPRETTTEMIKKIKSVRLLSLFLSRLRVDNDMIGLGQAKSYVERLTKN